MRRIVVCCLILLVMSSLTLTGVPSAFSQIENVKVLSYTNYIDSLGLLVVVGEVQNVGSNTIARVIIQGIATSSDGTQISSGTPAWVNNLIPQQKAPFYMEFYSQENGGAWISDIAKIEISVYQADATANYQYPDLKITNDLSSIGSTSDDKGVFWVTGKVENTGSRTAEGITVYATFFNNAKDVVAVGYSETIASLSSSSSASFKLGAFDMNQSIMPSDKKISSYSLLIQVQSPILEGAPPIIPMPGPTNTDGTIIPATTTPGPTNTEGAGSSESSSELATQWIYGGIAVVAIAVIAVAFIVLRKRSQSKPKPKLVSQSKKN